MKTSRKVGCLILAIDRGGEQFDQIIRKKDLPAQQIKNDISVAVNRNCIILKEKLSKQGVDFMETRVCGGIDLQIATSLGSEQNWI